MFFINKNKKGFNLFTALISLMLLSITIVFIFNMVQTEDNYFNLIQSQSKTSDLLTIADLVRADSFNSFIVNFRFNWAEFSNKEENFFTIDLSYVMDDWNSFVIRKKKELFTERNFPGYLSTSIIANLTFSNPPFGYVVSIPDYNKAILAEAMFLAIDTENIEVIGCGPQDNPCLGSLYFTLNFLDVNSEIYEKLPTVVVTKLQDEESIRIPIFEKRYYKVYLPWRGFQAFKTVRNLALTPELEKKEKNEIISGLKNSRALFNPQINYILDSAKIGVCDYDSCGLRTDLFSTASQTYFNKECNQPPEISNVTANNGYGFNIQSTEINLENSHSYNLSDLQNDTYKDIFKDLLKTTLKSNLERPGLYAGNNLLTVTDGSPCSNSLNSNAGDNFLKVCNLGFLLNSKLTKTAEELGHGTAFTPQSASVFFLDPYGYNQASNYSWFLIDGNIETVDDGHAYSTDTGGLNQHLNCIKLGSYDLLFKFEENDSKYKVLDEEISQYIYVKLVNHFSKYSFYRQDVVLNISNNGYLDLRNNSIEDLNTSSYIDPDKWHCYNIEEAINDGPACFSMSSSHH